jgi:hypothetical protein
VPFLEKRKPFYGIPKNSIFNAILTLRYGNRLEALIEQDIKAYPNSAMTDIKKRLEDVPQKDIQKTLYKMASAGILEHTNSKTHRRYWLAKKK